MPRFFQWTFGAFVFVSLLGRLSAAAQADNASAPATPGWNYQELRRFKASEAVQGVAVDREFFYAINNHAIGKYRKDTGERVAQWDGGEGGDFIHFNAAIIYNGKLLAAHSNSPGIPMLSSIETFDPGSLRHTGTHSFGRTDGSFDWMDRRNGRWVACFVHYAKNGEPGKNASWTQLIEFDDNWQRTAGWAFPAPLVARFGGYSASGGAFGPGGHLYVTGHDNPELYVLDFPGAGSVMKWIATIPISAEGQAFCWDPVDSTLFYTILRKSREVVVGRVTIPK
jgi:outer membrane protein assembly factor BamB